MRRLSWVPNDPLKQWHLTVNRAFDFWDAAPSPPLAAVRVAVIDSGIDATHPEFAGQDRSMRRASSAARARVDEQGHGTFVAGLIAAGVDNGIGIAGMAPSAELLVAKVVNGDDLIDVEAEVKAIHWAVENGARVINMSLGGFRDPRDPDRDAFSPLEAAAIGWAHGKGVVIVAAVGNSDEVPPTPWPFASYPAALPHVLGVSALGRDGSVPAFSNRDKIYNDITAPGQAIVSTFPLDLTAGAKECVDQGYSTCANDDFADFRKGEGTSFAAPQVSAAAAVLLAVRPNLRPEQVTALADADGARRQRGDRLQGLPAAARRAHRLGPSRRHRRAACALAARFRRATSSSRTTTPARRQPRSGARRSGSRRRSTSGTTRTTSMRFGLRRGQPVYVSVRGPAGHDTNLILWSPGTKTVDDLASIGRVARQSARPGPREYLSYRAPKAGTYYVQVKLGTRGAGRYKLVIVKA